MTDSDSETWLPVVGYNGLYEVSSQGRVRVPESTVSFPAWFEFHRDKVMQKHPGACTVYAAILGLHRIFFEPRPIKAWVLAEALEMDKGTVLKSLNLLVERGYLRDHGRSQNNVRIFSAVLKREQPEIAKPAA